MPALAADNDRSMEIKNADAYLNSLGDIGSYADVTAPDYWTYIEVVRKPKRTAPGPDTLPYSAWTATGHAGISTLKATDSELRQGKLPPQEFNTSSAVFLPKGSEANDHVEIIRTPSKTRPLSMKNPDNSDDCQRQAAYPSLQPDHPPIPKWICQWEELFK